MIFFNDFFLNKAQNMYILIIIIIKKNNNNYKHYYCNSSLFYKTIDFHCIDKK